MVNMPIQCDRAGHVHLVVLAARCRTGQLHDRIRGCGHVHVAVNGDCAEADARKKIAHEEARCRHR